VSVQKNVLCPFYITPRLSAVSSESPALEYIPEVPGDPTEVAQNHDARKTVSATANCKPRPSGVSLESSGLENIAQVRGNRAEFYQNSDARKAVSPTLSFLK